jgi:hypothetical protein
VLYFINLNRKPVRAPTLETEISGKKTVVWKYISIGLQKGCHIRWWQRLIPIFIR